MRLLALLLALLVATGCAGPFVAYKKAADAAMSPLSAPALVRDQALKSELRRVVLESESYEGLSITPAVFMERGFLVGFVDSQEQGEALIAAARQVTGLRSLETYLPVSPPQSTTESDFTLKGEVKTRVALDRSLVSARYTIEVLNAEVVLLGVVMSEEEREQVEDVVDGTGGVTGVKNFLLVVEEPYASIRPHLR